MGLDMMMYAQLYGDKLKYNEFDDSNNITELGYWRKSNQIHSWFVQNVQNGVDDCGYYDVSVEQIKELLSIVERVLEPEGGFFFGSTNIDSDYFDDLAETKRILEKCLAASKEYPKIKFYYNSSW